MVRPLICALLFCCLPALRAEKKKPEPDLRPAAVTNARNVFLSNADTSASPPVYQSFRATLEATHRFTLTPTPLGADLLLIFASTHPEHSYPMLTLVLRDAHTAVVLGKVEGRWVAIPNEKKNTEAVTRLMQALFALDKSGPAPSFTAVSVPDAAGMRQVWNSVKQQLADSVPTPQPTGIGTAVAEAKTVLIVDDGTDPDYKEYTKASSVFAAQLASAGRFTVVAELKDASILLRLTEYSYCAIEDDPTEHHCRKYQNALRVEADSTATLGFLFAASMDTSRNFDKTMKEFAKAFDKRVQEVTSHP